jgi:hypothetical protein
MMELEVQNKSWEMSLVKCQCIIRTAPGQQQQQQQSPALPQEQQKPPHGHEQRMEVGGRVYLMLQSKVAQAVDLAPGHKVRVYRPWFALWQQPRQQLGVGRSSSSTTTTTPSIDDACPVVLAHLLSNA